MTEQNEKSAPQRAETIDAIVRYDEIGLKGKNRPLFERRLVQNLRRVLGLRDHGVQSTRGRIKITAPVGADLSPVSRTFGVKSWSPATSVRAEPDLEAISAIALTAARRAVEEGVRTFKIDARRADKEFPKTSYEIAHIVGGVVDRALPELTVDVKRPELTIGVEVGTRGRAVVYCERMPGPGGLPVGSTGRALVLLSGGIDSPVAAWFAMKRGLEIECVYFHAAPYTGEKTKEKVIELARILTAWHGGRPIRVYIPAFGKVQDAIAEACPEPFWTLALRRVMYAVSDRLARAKQHGALITGECLGQVASQTLENLYAIDRKVDSLVLRPLVGQDKHEVIAIAERIGTFETSTLPYDDCCTLFAPARPKTKVRAADLDDACADLDIAALAELSLATGERVRIAGDGKRDVGPIWSKTEPDVGAEETEARAEPS